MVFVSTGFFWFMVQVGTSLRVVDNSGGRAAYCIRIVGGYKKRYARIGESVVVVVSRLRRRRKQFSKIKKGQIVNGLVVRTKVVKSSIFNDKTFFLESCVVLLNKKNKLFGTRIFGLLPMSLRFTRHMKVIVLAKGLKP